MIWIYNIIPLKVHEFRLKYTTAFIDILRPLDIFLGFKFTHYEWDLYIKSVAKESARIKRELQYFSVSL